MVNSTNGEGGTSYVHTTRSVPELTFIFPGSNSGDGQVILIPAIVGCGCDYLCAALDEYKSETACICPDKWHLKPGSLTSCQSRLQNIFLYNIMSLFRFKFSCSRCCEG